MVRRVPSISIAELAARIEAVEAVGRSGGPARAVVAAPWVTLGRSVVQEWLAEAPPQLLWIDLAARAAGGMPGAVVVWVGRACWPYLPPLGQGVAGAARLLQRSLFVDIPVRRGGLRAWALDLLLRSGAVAAVVADGRGMDAATSRRLQLAAAAGGALVLVWRSPRERGAVSVAHGRWQVSPVPTGDRWPRWRVRCLRCKAAAAQAVAVGEAVCVEDRGDEGVVVVSAGVVDRPCAAPCPPAARAG